jgi:hypothetical protein
MERFLLIYFLLNFLLPVIAESVYYDNLCNKCLPKFIKLLQLACLSVAGCRVIFSMLVMRSELELMEFSVKQNISIQTTLQMSPRRAFQNFLT